MQNRNIQEIIDANGNINLAAVRLKKSVDQLLTEVSSDPSSHEELVQKFRSRVLIQAYNTFMALNNDLIMNIESMEPKDKMKALGSIAEVLKHMLTAPENPVEAIFKVLPPDVKSSLERLMSKE